MSIFYFYFFNCAVFLGSLKRREIGNQRRETKIKQEDLSMTLIWVHLSGSIEDYEERVRNLGDLFTLCLCFKSDGNRSSHQLCLSPKDRMNGSLNDKKEKRGKFWKTQWYCSKKKNEWRICREMTLKKWPTNAIIYCIYYLHHSFYSFSWESFQNVSPKTLKGTYSEEMTPGFQIIRVLLISY